MRSNEVKILAAVFEINGIDRRTFLHQTAAAAALCALAPACSVLQQRRRPNLLYIMSDDLGYGDLGIMGRTDYTTSALDAFAREGVRLTQAYSAASVRHSRDGEARDLRYASAFIATHHLGRWLRYLDASGAVGAFGSEHDHDLRARARPTSALRMVSEAAS